MKSRPSCYILPYAVFLFLKLGLEGFAVSLVFNDSVVAGQESTDHLDKLIDDCLFSTWKPFAPKATSVEMQFIAILKVEAHFKRQSRLRRNIEQHIYRWMMVDQLRA